jgi:transposase
MPQEFSLRAKIILASADGEGVREMARRLEISPDTVCQWRRRYVKQGLEGLRTRPRPGRPRVISDAKERSIVSATMKLPKARTHWSTRRLGEHVGVSGATVQRIWRKYGLQPHRVETFKLSTDPQFDSKLADVVGLYLDPPERALVLCVDEKSQIQALNRTQPLLAMRPGLPARMTHDYERNGTTSLFAALEVDRRQVQAPRDPPDLRQLRNAQTPRRERVAGSASSLPLAFHADQFLVAQSRRALVCPDHRSSHPPRKLRERSTPRAVHQQVPRRLERERQTVQVDAIGERNSTIDQAC